MRMLKAPKASGINGNLQGHWVQEFQTNQENAFRRNGNLSFMTVEHPGG
jgi:hypothetical protein